MSTRKIARHLPPLLILALFMVLAGSGCAQGDNQLESNKTKAVPADPAVTSPATEEEVRTPTPLPTSTPAATPEPTSLIEIEPQELQGIELDFWHSLSGAQESLINELVVQFNDENDWGIRVKAESYGTLDQLHAGVLSAIQSGAAPDLATGYLYQALEWDQALELVDLNAYTEDPEWGLGAAAQDDFYPVFWEHDFDSQMRVGVPFQRSAEMLYYNVNWAYELGFNSAPTTIEEFKEQACAAAQANQDDEDIDNNGTGGLVISTNYSSILGWMYASGAEIVSYADGYDFDNQQVEDTFQYLRELYDMGCAWVTESNYPDSEFAARQALFVTGNLTSLPYQADAFQQADNDDQWTVIPFPSQDGTPAISTYGPSLVVFSSNDAQQLAAWLFARWLLGAETQARMVGAGTGFPISAAALEQLQQAGTLTPQWQAATRLLEQAHPEPGYRSWNLVRWAVYDAATQLFRYYFTIDEVPNLVKFLDQTANDLHKDPLEDSAIKAYKPTPQPTATLAGTPAAPEGGTGTPTPRNE